MDKNINIQQALFFSFLKKPGLKTKKNINMNYLIIELIKLSLLIFLVFSQNRLTSKYGVIFQISIDN